MRRRIAAVVLCAAGAVGGGCGDPGGPAPLLVFGAASAGDALRESVSRYAARDDGEPIALHVGGSGALVRQIELGAPADLLVSAGSDEIDRLVGAGVSGPADRRAIAANRLMIVLPVGAAPPDDASKLAEPRFERVAIGNPATAPVGRYAMAALAALDLVDTLRPRLVSAEHARQVLAWVERGEVDAGLVYLSDARHAGAGVVAGPVFDPATQPPALYEALVISPDGPRGERARRFVRWLAGDEARAIFAAHGFDPPPEGS